MSKNFKVKLSFYASLFVGLILLIAAFSKLFFPSDLLITFDRLIAIFEVMLVASLVLFHDEWKSWALIAPIFMLWAGYSFFWMLWGLPCGCLGKLVHLPSGLTLSLDILFFITALWLATLLGAGKRLKLVLLAAVGGVPVGFFIAYGVYRYLTYFINYVAD